MAFTAAELANIANSALDYYIKGGPLSQTIQEKPLLDAMRKAQKSFPGGKESIRVNVKGVYTTTIAGFTHDDTVSYSNPANIKQAEYPWKEIHAGIQVTMTELKKDGISVVDSMNGAETAEHSEREMTAISGLLEDKLEDMAEGYARGMNEMYWKDGTQDSLQVPGIAALVTTTPTTGVVAGIDRSTNTWWRNRASLSIDSSTPSNLNLINELRKEFRQLRRYGGRPNLILCGADFLDALEQEILSKGNLTDTGFRKGGATDFGMAEISYKGMNFMYDPTLDDLSKSKYCYVLDTSKLYPKVMDGEDNKQHTPARPHDKYVLYRAMTWTGGLVCQQMNAQGVYTIA